MSPKVSIVVPICNVEKFLRQCLDSIAAQTLEDIEVICVNDGSTDSSAAIIDEYVAKDSRFKALHKPNSGYGDSMNKGFAMATGEYIGIVESDDWIELDAMEQLYTAATENNADVAKAAFTSVFDQQGRTEDWRILDRVGAYGKVFSAEENHEVFWVHPSIWSAIYKADFIRGNNILFNPTPGASYQDTSFNFKVWACAERIILIDANILNYRLDNPNSSVNSPTKIFCICDEFDEIEHFLAARPDLAAKFSNVAYGLKCHSYLWNYDRIEFDFKFAFLQRMIAECTADLKAGRYNIKGCQADELARFKEILADPTKFFLAQRKEYQQANGLDAHGLNPQPVAIEPAEKPASLPRRIVRRLRR